MVGIATGKGITETHLQIFLRAIGCNWLVCLAVWLAFAAKDIAGKILGIVFPITAFVALGFDHVVANMFFLPLGIFIHTPGLGWGDVAWNLSMAFLGNALGAVLFVAGAYWYLYLRDTAPAVPAATGEAGAHAVAVHAAPEE
jgi:formate/nitrite transporter FocA (FNT family)